MINISSNIFSGGAEIGKPYNGIPGTELCVKANGTGSFNVGKPGYYVSKSEKPSAFTARVNLGFRPATYGVCFTDKNKNFGSTGYNNWQTWMAHNYWFDQSTTTCPIEGSYVSQGNISSAPSPRFSVDDTGFTVTIVNVDWAYAWNDNTIPFSYRATS